MYHFRRDPQTGEIRIVSRDLARIKQTLLYQITNLGQPFIYVVDGNYLNRGERTSHTSGRARVDAARPCRSCATSAPSGATVPPQMRFNDEMWLLSVLDPEAEPRKQKIADDTPKPAHAVA